MDVSVESNTQIASPLGHSFPSSPRKRTFHEVDADTTATAEIRKIQPSDHTENQENHAPLSHDLMDVDKPTTADIKLTSTTTPLPTSTPIPQDNDAPHPCQTSSTNESSSNNRTTLSPADTNTPAPPSTPQKINDATNTAANKKRKLSPASKEAKRLEKEEKERLKIEEKVKKEEEKRTKEEERRKRDTERDEEKKKREAEREEERKKREEKKKAKDEEKMAKEEEKRKKEEEKEKKERSQMKLNAFFAKPAATATPKPLNNNNTGPQHKSSSSGDGASSTPPDNEPEKTISDYHKDFPEFFLQSHTTLAPPHRFQRDLQATGHIRQKLDEILKASDENAPAPLPFRVSDVFNIIPYQRHRGRNVIPVKDILRKLQTYGNTIDLTGGSKAIATATEPDPKKLLRKVRMKSLKFEEDVRPPYQGTFTKALSNTAALKLCRAPYSRTLPNTNYDYDSEAEWEEPEEGEDLDSEGEEELSEDGDDDMEGFLDDEEENPVDGRRRHLVGDLEPVCTGIRWQEDNESDPEMQAYRLEVVSADIMRCPIDPFSTAYWPKPRAVEQAGAKGSLAPPVISARSTLHAYSTNSITHTQSPLAPQTLPLSTPDNATVGKAKRPFPPDQLAEFKQVVEGSDLTKTGLIEVLKKRFPKVSKDTLKDTLNLVAVRVGQKEADKKWVCK